MRSQRCQWQRKKWAIFYSGWVKKVWIYTTVAHERERQEKACHYFRTVREYIRAEDESSNSQMHTTRYGTRTRRASGWFYLKIKKPSSKMSISRQHWSQRQSFRPAYLGVKKPRCPEVPHRLRTNHWPLQALSRLQEATRQQVTYEDTGRK